MRWKKLGKGSGNEVRPENTRSPSDMSSGLDIEKGPTLAETGALLATVVSPSQYSDTKTEEPKALAPPSDHYGDTSYEKYCSDNALVWKHYMNRAEHDDSELAKVLNGDLESLLLFATLFSAIISAFLIEIRGIHDTPLTEYTKPTNWVNGLWLFSLLLSVTSAFSASLAKGWVSKYLYSADGGENWAAVRHRQLQARYRKLLKSIVQILPLPLHTSLLLFGIGLLVYLRDDRLGLRVVTSLVVGAMLLFYFVISYLPFLWQHSPFDTPLTTSVQLSRSLVAIMRERKQHQGNGPEQTPDQHLQDYEVKATALAWLLQTSVVRDVIRDSVHAVAGLPIGTVIQKAFVRESIARVLIERFAVHMEDSDDTSPKPYLHAILRLLQPLDPETSTKVLDLLPPSLVKFKVQERGIYEVALFILARILCLVDKRNALVPELRYTAVPILLKCSEPGICKLLSHLEEENRSNVIPKFVCCPTVIHTQEAQILGDLVKNARFRGEFVQQGGIEQLIRLPNVANDKFWVNIMFELMGDEDVWKITTVDEVSAAEQLSDAIAAKLQAQDDDVRNVGITTILELVENEKISKHIATPEIIGEIIKTARHSSRRIRQRSVEALGKLGGAVVIEETVQGLVNGIVEQLDCDDDDVRTAVVDALDELTQHETFMKDNKLIMAISKKLGGKVEDVKMASTDATMKLAGQVKVRDNTVTMTIIAEIIEKSNTGTWRTRQRNMQILGKLAKYVEMLENYATFEKMVNAIVNKFNDWDEDVVAASVQAIHELAKFEAFRKENMLMKAIVRKLSDAGKDVKVAGTEIVIKLAEQDEIRDTMMARTIIDQIIDNTGHTNSHVREISVRALGKLAKYMNRLSGITLQTLIRKFIEKFKDGDDDVRAASVEALVELAKCADLPEKDNSNLELINAIIDRFSDDDWSVRAASLSALDELATIEKFRRGGLMITAIANQLKETSGLLKPGAESTEVNVVGQVETQETGTAPTISPEIIENARRVRETSMRALGKLVQHEEFRKSLMTNIEVVADSYQHIPEEPDEVVSAMIKFIEHLEIMEADPDESDGNVTHGPVTTGEKLAQLLQVKAQPSNLFSAEAAITAINVGLQDANRFLKVASVVTVSALAVQEDTAMCIATSEIIERIIFTTNDNNWVIRQKSVTVLGKLAKFVINNMREDNFTVRNLINAIDNRCNDDDSDVRAASVRALGELAKHGPRDTSENLVVVRAIAQHLVDTSETVGSETLTVLKELASPPDEYWWTYDEDSMPVVVVKALLALAKDGTRESVTASAMFPAFFTREVVQHEQTNDQHSAKWKIGLQSEDEGARVRALVDLVKSKDTRNRGIAPSAVSEMIKNLRDQDDSVRKVNAHGLVELATFEGLDGNSKPQTNAGVNQKSGQKYVPLQVACVDALRDLADNGLHGKIEKEIDKLVDLLSDTNHPVQQATAEALGVLARNGEKTARNTHVMERLCKLLEDHKDKGLRTVLARALANFHLETDSQRWGVIAPIAEALADADNSVRESILDDLTMVLCKFEDNAKLIEYAERAGDRVRLEVLKALSNRSEQLAGSVTYGMITTIVNHLRSDNLPLRRAGLDALSNLAKILDQSTIVSEHILAIIDMLRDKDLLVRQSSVNALSNLGAVFVSPNLLQQLMKQLDEKDTLLAQSIADVLSNLAKTAGFGQRLPTDFWDKVVQWLAQPQTCNSGLRALEAFAKQVNLKKEIVNSAIVPALLEMRRSPTSWHAGTIGLFYLGLFE